MAQKQLKPHTVLKRHGLRARPVMDQYVIVATGPLHDPEMLALVGKWFTPFELNGLASNLEEADAIRRAEAKAEREEQQQRRPRWLYYW